MNYSQAMKIETQEEADAYFESLIEFVSKESIGKTRSKIEETQRSNLAYHAGYYGPEVRKRVERLFNCEHPIFGKYEENGDATTEEAIELGRLVASGSSMNLKTLRAIRNG